MTLRPGGDAGHGTRHRDGHLPAAAVIRDGLSRFHHLNDRQVMESPFTLSDAYRLVGRLQGF